jgi:hypothetical protein
MAAPVVPTGAEGPRSVGIFMAAVDHGDPKVETLG